jgi:hypothetical protein
VACQDLQLTQIQADGPERGSCEHLLAQPVGVMLMDDAGVERRGFVLCSRGDRVLCPWSTGLGRRLVSWVQAARVTRNEATVERSQTSGLA